MAGLSVEYSARGKLDGSEGLFTDTRTAEELLEVRKAKHNEIMEKIFKLAPGTKGTARAVCTVNWESNL